MRNLDQWIRAGREVSFTLRGGVVLRGLPVQQQEGEVELAHSNGDRSWLLVSEMIAATVHDAAPEEAYPRSEAEVRQWVLALDARLELDFRWRGMEAEDWELRQSWACCQQVIEALRGLSAEPQMRRIVESSVRGLRLSSADLGRFAVSDGFLEIGFGEDFALPPVRELQSLLAAIL